ncbi:MAG: TlpA family protein disulfide reductase [Deltaproteobacteria bacterium]|nr:TlpA family protein disulfide reductase [Deltaproteobacteria bacterium]
MRLALSLLAVLATGPSCTSGAPAGDVTPVTVLDERAFAALLANPDGGLLVVNLFATWCSACRGELPAIDRFSKSETDLRFAAVSLDEAGKTADVQVYATTLRLGLPVYHLSVDDPVGAVGRHLDVFNGGIPVTVVLGKDGRVHASHMGRVLENDLERLVSQARTAAGTSG